MTGDQILIIVDTDILIEIIDESSQKGEDTLKIIEDAKEDIIITSLNLHEILFGLYEYANNSKIEKILLLDATDFTKNDAALSALLEVKAEKKCKKIPRFGTMIAAVAINRGLKLFTFNKKHFDGFEDIILF